MPLKAKVSYKGIDRASMTRAIEDAAMATMKDATREGKRILKQVVGTQYASLVELRTLGHPYGLSVQPVRVTAKTTQTPGRGAMPMPAGYINRQTGAFAGSFIWEEPWKKSSGMIVTSLQSTDSDLEQILIQGTSRMVNRPFLTTFNIQMRDKVTNRMSNSFRRMLRIKLHLSR